MADRPPTSSTGQRADIQGLRTLSVGIVIAYHLRPDLLPGGFVGVDVFFVIGNMLVYRDNHLTATFARTLSGPLKRALKL